MAAQGRLSVGRLARVVILLALGLLLLALVILGGVDELIHPRSRAWVMAGGLIALLLALAEAGRLRHAPGPGGGLSAYLALPAAMVLGILYLQSGGLAHGAAAGGASAQAYQSFVDSRDREETRADRAMRGDRLVLEGDDYWPLYGRVFMDPQAARGKRIIVQGFVYHRSDLPPGHLIVARNLMWCCAADVGVIGFVLRGGEAGTLADNAWIEVEGVLGTMDFDLAGGDEPTLIPLIEASRIAPAERPASATIFP